MRKEVKLVLIFISVLYLSNLCSGQTGPLIPLTDAEKQIALDAHNSLRAAVNAQSMPPLVWVEALNIWTTNSVEHKCAWEETNQTVRTDIAGYSYIGENIAAGSIPSISFLMSGWASEKKIYTYGPMSWSNWQDVGHYTQQVWAGTYAIACVRVNCTISNPAVGYMLACNYGPGGNYMNQYPYKLCTTGTCPFTSPSPGGAVLNPASAAPSPSRSPSPCVPRTCSSNSCGTMATGCGSSINCGNCPSNGNCVQNVCNACTPSQTCSNKQCGSINNGCGSTISCGTCASGYICENYACTPNPVCRSCSAAGANCGTITISGCPTQSCGTCSTGYQCSSGVCTAIPCSSCPSNSVCSSGICKCLDGFQDRGDGNGCTVIPNIPQQFSEFYSSSGALNSNWVFRPIPGNLPSQPTYTIPELDAINNVQSRLSWNNANNFLSLELTTFTAQVKFVSSSSVAGLGLRLNQGASRNVDGIQWNFYPSGAVEWNLLWFGRLLNQGNYGRGTIKANDWNSISIKLSNTNSGGVLFATSTVSLNGVEIVSLQPVRPYDMLGGAYLYSSGQTSWRNLTIATRTTIRVAIMNCMSASSWSAFVSRALGVSASSVRLVNYTVNGVCAGQSTNKRQAAAAVGNNFIFSFESTGEIGSRALASRFIQLAQTWDESLADTGGVLSVDYVDPNTMASSEPIDYSKAIDLSNLDTTVPVPVPAATNGLSAGALAGIIIGSIGGALLLGAIVLAAVAIAVYLIVLRGRTSVPSLDIATVPESDRSRGESVDSDQSGVAASPIIVRDEEGASGAETEKRDSIVDSQDWKETEEVESEDENKPRGAADLYELNPRHHQSISGRVPEGYLPDGTVVKEMEVEVEDD